MNGDVLIVYIGGIIWYAIVGNFLYDHFGKYGTDDALDKMIWLAGGVCLGLILAQAEYVIIESGALPFLLGEIISAIWIIGIFSLVERLQSVITPYLIRRFGIKVIDDNEVLIVTAKDDQRDSLD